MFSSELPIGLPPFFFLLTLSRLLHSLKSLFLFDRICLPLSTIQESYKFTLADVAMRENGSSAHLRTLQIPPALVLSDFKQRRLTGKPTRVLWDGFTSSLRSVSSPRIFLAMMPLFTICIVLHLSYFLRRFILLPAPLAFFPEYFLRCPHCPDSSPYICYPQKYTYISA